MKALVLILAMAIGLLLPMTTNAQNGGTDNFFRGGGNDNYENRGTVAINTGGEGFTLGGATEADPAPLGSGLLVMVAAGAGYAFLKKKED